MLTYGHVLSNYTTLWSDFSTSECKLLSYVMHDKKENQRLMNMHHA